MNITTILGFLAATTVFIASVLMSLTNANAVLDLHAALIVLGGTAAVTLICFPVDQILGLLRVFLFRIVGRTKNNYADIIREVTILAEANRKGRAAFEAALPQIQNEFLKEAGEVLFWIEADVSETELRDLLETRAETHFNTDMNEAKIFRTMSKFPPAFGLMGTTIGMIALLQSLGNANAKNMIGPAMAVALVATLYGLVLTNFVFIPIAEHLAKQSDEDLTARRIAVEGIMLIAADKPSKYVEEKVKSFVLPQQRTRDQARDKKAA